MLTHTEHASPIHAGKVTSQKYTVLPRGEEEDKEDEDDDDGEVLVSITGDIMRSDAPVDCSEDTNKACI
jgi:hypothetical protein